VLCAAVSAGGCAGALEDPARFVYLLEDGGEVTADAGSDAGDSGTGDAGLDGGEIDGGADAGKDAGPSDSGPRDGGPRDGGADGGNDGGFDGGVHDGGTTSCDPVTLFFGPTCATGLCHSADIQQANLDLASPGMPGRLVGKASNGYPGFFLIDPANPDSSLMYTKTTATSMGFQMPLALDPLTDVEAACLLDWVRKAAANP
jgi:hypothetical protein